MIRRLLLLAAVGLALVVGGWVALRQVTERAWDVRKQKLAELALVRPEGRRPWEVRFEALAESLKRSPRFAEIASSPYRPHPALGGAPVRPLDEFERLWIETLWSELAGLDAVLVALRRSAPEDLVWRGETARLLQVRELTNALCGRAWLALEAGDPAAAGQAYADALRLLCATDDGSTMGTMVRHACQNIALHSVQAALEFRPCATALRTELVPQLEVLAFDPEHAERAIRVDLASIAEVEADPELADDPAGLLSRYAWVEEALALAREPASTVRARLETKHDHSDAAFGWSSVIRSFHRMHAERNVALTALAVAAHRERHGRFPAALADVTDLPAEHALDPLTGTPLPYWTDGATARIGPSAWSHSADAPSDERDVWILR